MMYFCIVFIEISLVWFDYELRATNKVSCILYLLLSLATYVRPAVWSSLGRSYKYFFSR